MVLISKERIIQLMSMQTQAIGWAIARSLGAMAILLGGTVGILSSAAAQTPHPVTSVVAQSPTPVTYVTVLSSDQIVMQIQEGEFYFHEYLDRTSGNTFVGHDEQVRVIYDRDTSRVVVINLLTGDEYYNYFFSSTSEGAL